MKFTMNKEELENKFVFSLVNSVGWLLDSVIIFLYITYCKDVPDWTIMQRVLVAAVFGGALNSAIGVASVIWCGMRLIWIRMWNKYRRKSYD